MLTHRPVRSRVRLPLLVTVLGVFTPTMAPAIIVSGNPLPKADQSTFPGGVFAVDVTLSAPPNSFLTDFSGTNFSYSATTHAVTVSDTANALNLKHVWLHMEYTPGDPLPQPPLSTFDPAEWPSLTSPATGVMVTDASSSSARIPGSNVLELTWDISPQPASETISLGFPNLRGDFGGIFKVEVATICTPIPEPPSLVSGLLGAALVASGWWWHRRAEGPHPAPPPGVDSTLEAGATTAGRAG